MSKPTSYGLRKAEKVDNQAINALYVKVTGRKRSLQQYRWEWESCPAGPGRRWVIYNKNDGNIVAHHGLIPIKFNIHGQSILAGKTENTMVDPHHRTKLYYGAFEKMALNEARKEFDLLFTTAGGGAPGIIRRRMGYSLVGHWITYIFYAGPSYVTMRIKSQYRHIFKFVPRFIIMAIMNMYASLRIFMLKRSIKLKVIKAEDIKEYMNDIESFWYENRGYFDLTPERDIYYLKWRILDNPYNRYEFYFFYNKGKLNGYIITKIDKIKLETRLFKKMVIEDMVSSKNSARLYGEFIRNLKSEFKNYDLVGFRTLYRRDKLNKLLAKLQFFPWRNPAKNSRHSSPFYAYYVDPSRKREWFVTEILTEGLL